MRRILVRVEMAWPSIASIEDGGQPTKQPVSKRSQPLKLFGNLLETQALSAIVSKTYPFFRESSTGN